MEVRPGYKRTEVGVIPEDWDWTTVRKLASPVRNAIVGGPFGSDLVSKDYVETGVPVVRGQNMGRRFLSGTFAFVTQTKAASLEANLARPGDLLFTQRGTLGQISLVPDQPYGRYLVSQSQMKLTVDRKAADPLFFYYVFSSAEQQESVRKSTIQTSLPHINLGILRAWPVQRPPLAEQEAIAEALSDADALIESLEQLLVKKRRIKQGTMQELLTGKRRLPGFQSKGGCKQTEIGIIPNDWDVSRLGDLFEITSSKRVFQREWKTEGVPFYRARELAVLSETGFIDNDLFISQQMYEAFRRAHGVPQVGDLLVTGVGTLGKVFVVSDSREFYFKDGNIIWFKVAGAICPGFLRQLYLMPAVVKQIADSSAGTTVGTYTISNAKKTVIPYPTMPEQEAIATVLSDIDVDIAVLDAKLVKARELKEGMMQELLTGRIRLV